jgi:hypothetical protein
MGKILNIKNKSIIVICLIVFSSCANRYKTLGETMPHLIYTDVVTWRYPNYYYDVPDTTIRLHKNKYANHKNAKDIIDSSDIEILIKSFSSNESAFFLQNIELFTSDFRIGDTFLFEFGTYVFEKELKNKFAFINCYHRGKTYFYEKDLNTIKYTPVEPNYPLDTFAWSRFLEKDCYRFNLTTSGSNISNEGYKFIRLSAKEVEVTYCGGKGMNKYKVLL